MLKKLPILLNPAFCIGLLLLCCARDIPILIVEPLEGNCIGTIRDIHGATVAGASIILVPVDYLPLSPDNKVRIDSTVSDDQGRFGFTVDRVGLFNLISRKNTYCSMHSSVSITTGARITLKDEILTSSGSIKGKLQLQGKTLHQSALILAIGTNRYTEPSDSTGNFYMEGLPPGSYTLRIVPIEASFTPVETTVTVTSETITDVPVIQLSRKYNPTVNNFSVQYNSATMNVHLTWDPLDTTLVTGYALYLNRPTHLQPTATMSDTCSTLSLDIITLPFDTFAYQICAIGNDGKTGPPTNGMPFVKQSALQLLKTTNCTIFGSSGSNHDWAIDNNGNIYEITGCFIGKTDSNGVVVATYTLPNGGYCGFVESQTDESGNLYSFIFEHLPNQPPIKRSLVKFDRNLAITAQLNLDSKSIFDYVISGDGTLLLFSQQLDSNNYPTIMVATKYSSNFTKITQTELFGTGADTMLVPYQINTWYLDRHINYRQTIPCNDTVFCALYQYDQYAPCQPPQNVSLQSIDSNLALLFSPKTTRFIDISVPDEQESTPGSYSTALFSPCGILVTKTSTNITLFSGLITFFNTNHQQLARMPWDNLRDVLQLDNKGNLYIIRQNDPSNATIYKYSTSRIIRQNAP